MESVLRAILLDWLLYCLMIASFLSHAHSRSTI